ncbi:MAG: hypothetical protein HY864_08420 [Chloroflexi bacterium]|nr:hypothetical protein [Chloroflexota bacterium]
MRHYPLSLSELKKHLTGTKMLDSVSIAALLLAIVFPFLVIALFPKFYHTSDVDDFWRWSQAWKLGWKNIYINCDRCNYPFLGTFISGGVMDLMGIEKFKNIVAPFRYYLAVIDALSVLAVFFILTKLKVRNSPLWAGIIGLLPSSWIGSSVWGQIDGVGQLLMLTMILLCVWFNLNGKVSTVRYFAFILAAGFLMSLMLLTKQLIMFSLLTMGFMTLVNLFFYLRKPADIALSIVIVFIAFTAPILWVDLTVNLKEPYFSHLQYVLATGSKHGDTISSFGFNIWTFLAPDPLGSSHVPVYIRLGTMPLFSVVPFTAGITLFLFSNALMLFFYIKYFYGQYMRGAYFFNSENILLLLLHLALVNLSFNLFLTGTHERYLYHFYPFVIMACLGLFDQKYVYILLAGAAFYGLVLYGYLSRLNLQFGHVPFWVLGVFHIVIYFALVILVLRYTKSQNLNLKMSS